MLRIKRLYTFMLQTFLPLFFMTFGICLFIVLMQFLWKYIDDMVGKGLGIPVLAEMFFYAALFLVPMALPLAILLASLMTFGNLGERLELLAMKSAGVSLIHAMRPLIVFIGMISIGAFFFQNNVMPVAQVKLYSLLYSIKQKSPELEIPEGIFYDGIPNTNLYVQKKDLNTGKLYGIMIYRINGSYEDAAIILADSGMLQSTAEKKHLLLNLYSGEWFENMQSSEIANSAAVPYRRETFITKRIILDFDAGFSLTDAASISNNERAKSLSQIQHTIDSLNIAYDSVGREYYAEAKMRYYSIPHVDKKDSLAAVKKGLAKSFDIDSTFARLDQEKKMQVVDRALSDVQQETSDLDFKSMITEDADQIIRQHQIEAINKFTLALSCLIFFFIGA
ncbi:MAG TPA: hypothetical protein DDZ04_05505, partial [Parabacteroides sp.]|nr:hypothetical protein [Parabacteroides sp.]